MSRETRSCQNCNNNFTIEPEDFKFYEKIKVPPPTWCPECRMVRRTAWRNEATVYRRKCELCGRDTISVYSSDKPFKIYCRDCWWSDRWEPINFKQNYDFSKPFFNQFRSLMEAVPHSALQFENVVNSEYLNHAANIKNGYLVFASHDLDNVSYSRNATFVKDSLDIDSTDRSEFCYEIFQCVKDFKVSFSGYAEECRDSGFLFDCRNCNNCVASVALRNKSYYIFNEPYSKEDFISKSAELDLGSFKNLQKAKSDFGLHILKYPRRFATIRNSVNVIGNNIYHAKNCFFCFDLTGDAENCKYCLTLSGPVKDSYDVVSAAYSGTELLYEMVSCIGRRLSFGYKNWHCNEVTLSEDCHSSNDLLACVGLRNKSYCILNKQYTKEEYMELVPRIVKHMDEMPYVDQKGRVYKYGEFFPPELSPFAYNETIAQEYFPLSKSEALAKGYSWKDPEPRNYEITLKTEDLPDHIKDVKDSILNEIIQCAHWELWSSTPKCNEQCTQAYKIIPQELAFLRRMSLPLPRLCPNCRHYQRIKQRNPLKLWHRKCQCAGLTSENKVYSNTADHIHHKKDEPCQNEFETTYAPERPEIVYCEQCYLREVV